MINQRIIIKIFNESNHESKNYESIALIFGASVSMYNSREQIIKAVLNKKSDSYQVISLFILLG